MNRVFKTPYAYWLAAIFFAYLILLVYLSEFYVTIQYIPRYLNTLNWAEFGVSILLSLTIAGLIALNAVYGFIRWQERRVAKEGALACAGGIGGFAAGVCPACVTSVFPFIFSTFGVSFSWASLPLRGFEIQFITLAILSGSLYLLRRE
ncbi:hypothetical protein C4580_00940 [Candidatus Woesearchaeota archaeon]|nr:MAG: hypothetical protein C4580_00940 [Candidatus Woesearchaeota archaeon]